MFGPGIENVKHPISFACVQKFDICFRKHCVAWCFSLEERKLNELLKDKSYQILSLKTAKFSADEIARAKQCCLLWCRGRQDEVGQQLAEKAANFLQEERDRGPSHGPDETQLDICRGLLKASNFGADEVKVTDDPMPELLQCRLRVGNAIKENDSKTNELGKLIQHLSFQNGPVFESHLVLKVLPSTIQALWQSIDASDPGPITLKKLTQVLETFATKVELDVEAFLSGGTTSTTSCSDFAWVMNLASISDPAELSARLRAHMLTPLHASLTAIEPEESLKAAQLCDCFLSSVCKMKKVCWYEKVESYLQNPVSQLRTDVDLTMVHEYVGDAEPWLLLDATALAQNACEWMAVDATGSHVKDANAFATQLRMLQLLEFDGKNSALRMAEIATAVFHRASSILPPEGPQTSKCNNEPLIQEADPESSTAWPSQFEIVGDDDDEFAECIECDKAPDNLKTTSIQQALRLVH